MRMTGCTFPDQKADAADLPADQAFHHNLLLAIATSNHVSDRGKMEGK